MWPVFDCILSEARVLADIVSKQKSYFGCFSVPVDTEDEIPSDEPKPLCLKSKYGPGKTKKCLKCFGWIYCGINTLKKPKSKRYDTKSISKEENIEPLKDIIYESYVKFDDPADCIGTVSNNENPDNGVSVSSSATNDEKPADYVDEPLPMKPTVKCTGCHFPYKFLRTKLPALPEDSIITVVPNSEPEYLEYGSLRTCRHGNGSGSIIRSLQRHHTFTCTRPLQMSTPIRTTNSPAMSDDSGYGSCVPDYVQTQEASSISSESVEPLGETCFNINDSVYQKLTIRFEKGAGRKKLGFTVVGGTDSLLKNCNFVIRNVMPDGQGAENGLVKRGDQIVSVNGKPLRDLTHSEGVALFKEVTNGEVFLEIVRKIPKENFCSKDEN